MNDRRIEDNVGLGDCRPNSNYYEWCRRDIIALVPADAHHILSVGCGAGVTESVLVKCGKHVLGVEIDPVAAALARNRGLEIIEEDVSRVAPLLEGRIFDCLIYADVLEHIPNPEQVLAEHVSLLSARGSIIVSVPNFRHYSVLLALLKGDFRYQDSGIFDRTHVRITTKRTVLRWMSNFDFDMEQCQLLLYRRWMKIISALTLGLMREFLATQVLVGGKRKH